MGVQAGDDGFLKDADIELQPRKSFAAGEYLAFSSEAFASTSGIVASLRKVTQNGAHRMRTGWQSFVRKLG